MTHLRVFERQGPIRFSRGACMGSREPAMPIRMTDTATLVTCGKCRRTRWFKQAATERQGKDR